MIPAISRRRVTLPLSLFSADTSTVTNRRYPRFAPDKCKNPLRRGLAGEGLKGCNNTTDSR